MSYDYIRKKTSSVNTNATKRAIFCLFEEEAECENELNCNLLLFSVLEFVSLPLKKLTGMVIISSLKLFLFILLASLIFT